MRTILRFLLLTFVIAGTLYSQPKLIIEGGKRIDLGDLYTSQPAKHVVTLRNAGTDTLVISEVSATCGCTGTMMSNDRIPPGSTGSLAVTFDPRTFSGKVEKGLSFRTNDPEALRNHLTLSANVIKILTVEPDNIVFMRVYPDSTIIQEVVIDNDTDSPIRILSISASSDELKVESPETTIESGTDIILTCSFKANTPGIHKGNIEIRTDHPKLPLLTIRYFGLVTKDKPSTSSAQ